MLIPKQFCVPSGFRNKPQGFEWNKDQNGTRLLFSLMTAFSVHLTGTKYGCGGGGCGACTVMISTYDPASKKIRYPKQNILKTAENFMIVDTISRYETLKTDLQNLYLIVKESRGRVALIQKYNAV